MNQTKADLLQERLDGQRATMLRLSQQPDRIVSSAAGALAMSVICAHTDKVAVDAISALREAQAEIERLNSLGRERDGSSSDVGRGHRGDLRWPMFYTRANSDAGYFDLMFTRHYAYKPVCLFVSKNRDLLDKLGALLDKTIADYLGGKP